MPRSSAYGWDDLDDAIARLRHGEVLDLKTGVGTQLTATAEGFQRAMRTSRERLIDAEILTRLVALNAERAAEEAEGKIRWLRPGYQAPAGATTQGGLSIAPSTGKTSKRKPARTKEPWPKTLPERVLAVERALRAGRPHDQRSDGKALPPRQTRRPRRNPRNAGDARPRSP